MNTIQAKVTRGKHAGEILKPHRYKDGYYLVAKHGNTLDCSEKVYSINELKTWIERGYSIRMSTDGVAPSLFSPKSLSY